MMNFYAIYSIIFLSNSLVDAADYSQSQSMSQGYTSGSTGYTSSSADYTTTSYSMPARMMGQMNDWMQGNDVDLMKYMQPNEIGRDRRYDKLYQNDGCLCTRDCCKYPEPRICYYKFFIEQYTAMGPACRNCSTGNTSDCYQNQCIIADGVERMVFSINRKIPGPQIDVCYGDRIVCDVMNLMTSASVTLHWHGMKQERSPWMDGVPYLTQCPILPNGQFRYDFIAETPGTLFYHSHIGNLQRDGCHGSLIVRTCGDPNAGLYTYDLPSHVIDLSDWFHVPSDNFFPGYYRSPAEFSPVRPMSCIINGMGSYSGNTTQTFTPHARFFVKCDTTYRFRVICSATSNCPVLFTIVDHPLKVIAVDGSSVEPTTVNSVYMGSGMRTGFVLTTKKRTNCKQSYLMVVQSQEQCLGYTKEQWAYLVYEDCPSGQVAPPLPANVSTLFTPTYLDRVDFGCNNNRSNPPNICSSQLRSVVNVDPRLTCGEPDYRFFLNTSAYQFAWDDIFNNKIAPYQFFYLPAGGTPQGPPPPGAPAGPFTGLFADTLMDGISAMMPPCPLLTQGKTCRIPENMWCRNGRCPRRFCSCINVLEVRKNSYVELVCNDNLNQNHPLHLHGHDFVVLDQGSAEERQRDPFYYKRKYCKTRKPVVRDVSMPLSLGFVVIRFYANNPGYWLFHCHFQQHMDGGMFLFFKVGDSDLPIPENFPTCGPYLPEAKNKEWYTGSGRCSYGTNELYRYNYSIPTGTYIMPEKPPSMPVSNPMKKHI